MQAMSAEHDRRLTSTLGKGMVFTAWLLVLGLLTVFFNDWQERQTNPNRRIEGRVTEGGAREVSLQRNRYGHYVTSGRINGHDVVYLLDTGATSVSIPAGVAERLGLERGMRYRVGTANGEITVYATRLARLELGNIVLRGVRAHINPYMSGEEILLGMSALKQLELEQRGGRLTLRQHAQK